MSLIDELKTSVRVSELAAEYSEVRQRGRLRVCRCLCGQNSDRNPSFTLYDQDNHFHCYACGRHGSVIDLVMLTEGLDVKAACQHLRECYLLGRASADAPRVVARPTVTPTSHAPMRSDVAAMLRETVACYALNLANTPEIRQQLHQRGLADGTIAKLQIGYANGNLARHLHERGQPLSLAAQIGLLTQRGELLRDRIVFPVLDAEDQPLFLIGRATTPRQQPKYLGLPDGLVHKRPMMGGHPVHGIVLVEGAVDFAALVQWGVTAEWLCIALLGTAHARVVAHLAARQRGFPVVIALDQDKAGKEAALKTALALREVGMSSCVVIDADRQAYHHAGSVPASDQVRAELALVNEIAKQGFARWVHWHNHTKDCGDLLMQTDGAVLFHQALV